MIQGSMVARSGRSQRTAHARRGATLLVTFASLLSLGARAAEPASDAAFAANETPALRAAELFREAEALYVIGDVAGALERMQSAYDVSGRPELLFNLGQLQRELGHCVEAVTNY